MVHFRRSRRPWGACRKLALLRIRQRVWRDAESRVAECYMDDVDSLVWCEVDDALVFAEPVGDFPLEEVQP